MQATAPFKIKPMCLNFNGVIHAVAKQSSSHSSLMEHFPSSSKET